MHRVASIALLLCLLPTMAADVVDVSVGDDDERDEWFPEDFPLFVFIVLGVLLSLLAIMAAVAAAS